MSKRSSYRLAPENDPGWVRFWRAFPKRVAKMDARKAFAQLNPTPDLINTMIAAIERQSVERAVCAQRGQWVAEWPYPATWIRGERWTDEPLKPSVKGATRHVVQTGQPAPSADLLKHVTTQRSTP